MLASSPGDRREYFCAPSKVAAVLLAFGAIGNLASAQGISFRDPVDVALAAGSAPEALAVGHFKGDNAWDLVVVNGGSDTISIFLGNGDGSFLGANTYDVGTNPWYVTAADLNGDNILDLVVSNQDSSDLLVLLGVGDGTFVYAESIPIPDGTPFSTVVADFNSDGAVDIIVTNTFAAYIIYGFGDGTFADPIQLADFGSHARALALGDFNQDGIVDVAVSKGHGVDQVSIMLGHGDGTFESAGDFPIG
jgi:hypothetical protein